VARKANQLMVNAFLKESLDDFDNGI